MYDLYFLIKDYSGDPQKALDVLADTLEDHSSRYTIDDVVSALRTYQGQQLLNLAEKEGLNAHTDMGKVLKFLESHEGELFGKIARRIRG